jgi:hypothetical protein
MVSFPCIPFFPSVLTTSKPCARPAGFVFAPAIHGSLSTTGLFLVHSPLRVRLRPSRLRLAPMRPIALG